MGKQRFEIKSYADWVTGKRGRWITLLVWIMLVGILNMLLPQANSQVNDSAGDLDRIKPSMEATALVEQEYPNENGLTALVVWYKATGLGTTDLQSIQEVIADLSQSPLPHQGMIPPLHILSPDLFGQRVSDNGTTLIMPLFFEEGVDASQLELNIDEMGQRMGAIFGANPLEADVESGNISARVTGPAGILVDATQLFSSGDFSLTIATFLFVLIVLLLIYRSPILAFIPLIGVMFAYGILSPLLGGLAQQGWVVIDSQGLSIMTVLLFGAGTDYCLFLIARFRQFLRMEESTWNALKKTIYDKSGAVMMSALTTIFALAFLLLADLGPIERFAIPFVLAILLVVLSSLTLVPALLAILGRVSFFPFIPRTPEMIEQRAKEKGKPVPVPREGLRIGEKLSSFVVNKARTVTVLASLVLLLLASFVIQIQYTYDTLSSFPEDMPSREGFILIEDSFNPGQLGPIKIMVDTGGNEIDVVQQLQALSYVGQVSEPVEGQRNSDILAVDVELTLNPYSNEAMNLIPELREVVINTLVAAGITEADHQVWIAGQTAEQYDVRETSNRDALILVPLIILIIAILVLLYLRSITAMIYLMLTVIVSYFSALGLGWIVIHYVLGAEAIQGFIPLYAFIFLAALGIDYNIFMKSSIWKKARFMPLKQAIKEGATETGAVINSAGIILAGTFAVLATLPIQILVHFGLIMAIGVLIDTFIVRPFLVPAIMTWFGAKAFWPGKYNAVEERVQVVESE